ncbi:Transglutaminase-like superfamily protein [Rubripirellula tenax]|uniref:Transglutaminase-like superfamily protein n=1 Tax=Rubripirellula tenax TaxID=2528015 RepID=A0A5C6FC80_9BACT|nr:transglutaminase domain-containing protein [Rubripirellula tenax]TWU59323.1 Transglutaminase-like superfamily protein [Rubripirellula tenax]
MPVSQTPVRQIAAPIRARTWTYPLAGPTIVFLFATAILFHIAGCDIPARPPLVPADVAEFDDDVTPQLSPLGDSAAAEVSTEEDGYELPVGAFEGDWHAWDIYSISDSPVGYNHLMAEAIDEEQVRYDLDNVLFVNQGKARTLQRLMQTSYENRDGQLIRFESELHVGPVVTRTVGIVNGEQLKVETVRGTQKTSKTVTWSDSYRGLVAIEQSLRAKPMTRRGETRNLRMLMPGQFELATARLRCSGTASVPNADQTLAQLNEINFEIQVDGQNPIYSTVWTDDEGNILRSVSQGMQFVGYRSDAAAAKAAFRSLNDLVAIPVSGTFERPSESIRLAITVSPTAKAASEGLTMGVEAMPGQMVRDADDGTIQVLISRLDESTIKGFRTATLAPQPGDFEPNALVDSNASLIQRYATAAIGTRQLTPTEIAIELTRTTQSLIDDRKLPSGLVRASSVANDAIGDRLGKSIFLVALLRSQKIPARLAIGMKYADDSPDRMVFHPWTLAFVDEQWIHLDASEGDVAAADRLMFATTDLAAGNEYSAFVPLFNSISRIEIRVLRAQYAND